MSGAGAEPDTRLNTTQLRTKAHRRGDSYVLNGLKTRIYTAQVTEKMLILARTTPLSEVKDRTGG